MLSPLPYIRKVIYEKEHVPSDKLNEYPYSIPVVKQLEELELTERVTIIIGENGSGKSTLIEAIAQGLGFSPEGGSKDFNVKTAEEDYTVLHNHFKYIRSYKRPQDYYFLRAESFYNIASYMDEVRSYDEYGGKSLHWRSHGEAFMAVLTGRLRGKGLYIFDEPEAALSPQRQLTAIAQIHKVVQDDSQVIMATHSPIFMAYPGAQILFIQDGKLVEQKFEETDHFKTYDLFFKGHATLMDKLLNGSDH